MSRPQSPIVCDGPGCGKTKQEANHWWVIGVGNYGGGTCLLVTEARSPYTLDERYKLFDFCGQTCALKFISEQMGKAGEQNAKI